MLIDVTASIQNPSRHIELDIDIGADARDWSGIQAKEKLTTVETELRRIDESVNEIVQEMEYLRLREQKLRDTNESTNERVKWFALGTMGMLVGLGAWQVVYLRAYFRYVLKMICDDECGANSVTDRSISSRLSMARSGIRNERSGMNPSTHILLKVFLDLLNVFFTLMLTLLSFPLHLHVQVGKHVHFKTVLFLFRGIHCNKSGNPLH